MKPRQKVGMVAGVSVFLLLLALPAPEGMNPLAMRAAAVSLLMAIFWVTEAISIFATCFIPIALFLCLEFLGQNKLLGATGTTLFCFCWVHFLWQRLLKAVTFTSALLFLQLRLLELVEQK